MIIECPACNTRYNISVELPPEGRTVRCAKCGNVWRATAIEEEEELYSAAEAGAPAGDEAGGIDADADGQGASGWGYDEETQAFSHGYRQATEIQEDEEPSSDTAGYFGAEPAPAEEDPGAEETGQGESQSKVHWFGSFLRKNQKPAASAPDEFDVPQPARTEPAPFPRPAPAAAPQPPADTHARTLDDARAAVRNVFASLGEQRPHHGATTIIQAPVTAYADDGQDGGFSLRRPAETGEASLSAWETGAADGPDFTLEPDFTEEPDFAQESSFAQESGFAQESDYTREPGFAHEQEMDASASTSGWPGGGTEENGPSAVAPQGWLQGWQQQQQEEEEPEASVQSDLDAQLRAALQAHFPSHTAPGGSGEAPETEFRETEFQETGFQQTGFRQTEFQPDDPAAEDSESQISEALTAFWKRPATVRSQPSSGQHAPLDEDGDPVSVDISFDEHLYREIEETQEQSGHPRFGANRAGLALAAAWGLFLCVATGLVGGLLGFRDIAADALPGLAPFYRALGMPVTVQPLIFEGVQYEWAVTDFKPVLHIKGAVYNRAQRGVKVPQFIVSIKDNDPALDKEFPSTLPVDGDRIAPEERTEFELELVSPSRSITAVELELRNVH